jgi:protein subunit release factor A
MTTMNMHDLRVEAVNRKREGMQPVTVWHDLRVTHIPTGLVVEVPHELFRSQNKALQAAADMIKAGLESAVILTGAPLELSLDRREAETESRWRNGDTMTEAEKAYYRNGGPR